MIGPHYLRLNPSFSHYKWSQAFSNSTGNLTKKHCIVLHSILNTGDKQSDQQGRWLLITAICTVSCSNWTTGILNSTPGRLSVPLTSVTKEKILNPLSLQTDTFPEISLCLHKTRVCVPNSRLEADFGRAHLQQQHRGGRDRLLGAYYPF